MLPSRGAGDIPNLLEPTVKICFTDSAFFPLLIGWFPVSSRFALHQDELNIVFNNGIWFVGFSKKLGSVFYLIGSVGNLVPDNRVQIVEADTSAYNADIGMKWKNQVSSKISSRDAYIADNAHKAAAGDKDTVDVPPDFLQLKEKRFIILNMA